MTIKEVSEQYEISQDTLRYYERVGMIPPVTRTAGGIRNYTAEDLRWVELAKCMRSAGLPVEAVSGGGFHDFGQTTTADRSARSVAGATQTD